MLFGDNMFVGNTAVDAVYLGDAQVWSAIPADVKAHIARVTADGGTVPEQAKMVSMVKKLMTANLWNNCVFFGLPLGGVKKDGNQFVSKVYDIKNNADLLQATGTAQPKFNVDGSLLFDGGDKIQSASLGVGNPVRTTSSNASVFCWVKFAPNPNILQMILVRYATTPMYQFLLSNGGAAPYFNKMRIILSTNGTGVAKLYYSIPDICTGEWAHVGFTFTNNNLKLYVNGVECIVEKITDSICNTLANVNTGINVSSPSNSTLNPILNGNMVALPQIYNSTLTAEQVMWNFNNIRAEGL